VALTPTVTFRGIASSPSLEADIRARAEKLEKYCHTITSCRVVVELAERHHTSGRRFHVRIELTVPSDHLIVSHDASSIRTARDLEADALHKTSETDAERKDAMLAVHDAFDIAKRQVQDYVRRQREAGGESNRQPRGHVVRVFPVDEYGYIAAEDGHEVYFQKSSVLNGDFDHLEVGSLVSFVEVRGDRGPQASTVRMIGRHKAASGPAPAAVETSS
jgi:cold shock CspA family protein/ribosome-associated translation inhibitor RaiA